MKWWLAILSALVLVTRSLQADDLAILCQSGHEQARKQIKQLKCRVVVQRPPEEVVNYYTKQKEKRAAFKGTIDWIQDGDKIRTNYISTEGFSYQAVWDGKELRILNEETTAKNKARQFGDLDSDAGLTKLESPWRFGLFGWPEKHPAKLTQPWLNRMEEKSLPSGRYIIAHTTGPSKAAIETWFSPKTNFLVAKTVVYPNPSKMNRSWIREVTAFLEPLPGVHFPSRIILTRMHDGQTTVRETVTIDQVKINEPIDPSEFILRFPPGLSVTDNPNKVYRSTDHEGKVAGVTRAIPPPRNLASPESLPTEMQTSWLERNSGWMLGSGFVGAFLLTSLWWRFRSRTPDVRS